MAGIELILGELLKGLLAVAKSIIGSKWNSMLDHFKEEIHAFAISVAEIKIEELRRRISEQEADELISMQISALKAAFRGVWWMVDEIIQALAGGILQHVQDNVSVDSSGNVTLKR